MVDEADVRQDGNIDYKCLCSQFTLTSSIIRLFSRVQQIFDWKRRVQEEQDKTTQF